MSALPRRENGLQGVRRNPPDWALYGFSLDNLSLMALTIAAGFVVDDAIIVIGTFRADGEWGDRDRRLTSDRLYHVSITVAPVAALTPVLFMPDVVGRVIFSSSASR